MLLKLRPSSRNVKLALSALCKARAACSHERLVGMVRYGRWSLRRERLSSASIVSWARTANGQMALAANIPSRAASSPKKPPPRPSTDLTAGAMVTLLLLCPSTACQPELEKPLQATSDGSVSWSQECCNFPKLHHYVLSSCSVAGLHVLTRFACPVHLLSCRESPPVSPISPLQLSKPR